MEVERSEDTPSNWRATRCGSFHLMADGLNNVSNGKLSLSRVQNSRFAPDEPRIGHSAGSGNWNSARGTLQSTTTTQLAQPECEQQRVSSQPAIHFRFCYFPFLSLETVDQLARLRLYYLLVAPVASIELSCAGNGGSSCCGCSRSTEAAYRC